MSPKVAVVGQGREPYDGDAARSRVGVTLAVIGREKRNTMPLDDLPGLDDDEELPEASDPTTAPPAEEPQADESLSKEPPATPETASPRWTDKELDDWWEHDFGGNRRFDEGSGAVGRVDASDNPDFEEAYQALRDLSYRGEGRGYSPFPVDGWGRLSHEMKEKFRSGWEASLAADGSQAKSESVVPELATYGPAADDPVGSVGDSVVDELSPFPLMGSDPKPAAEPDEPVPDAEKTSAAPWRVNWIWFVPVVGAALGLGLFFFMGGSAENPTAAVDISTDEPSAAVAVGVTSEDVEVVTTAPAVNTTAVRSGVFPPEDYGPCHIHPEEDAANCRPHYDLGVSATSINNFGDAFYIWETTQAFMGPVPVNPEFPIEYRLVIESTNGQRIEHLLSGGPGEPLTCLRLVNGVEAPLVEGEICGEFTAPDSLDMLIDVTTFSPGIVSWFFSTLETEPDGTRHGDWIAGGGNENFELP